MLRVVFTIFVLCTCARAQDSRTIFQYLQDENFNKLVELIIGAGLQNEFEETDAIKTLFAPSDAAFSALSPDVFAQLQTNMTLLKEVLLGHVIVNEAMLGLFIREGVTKTSGSGDTLSFKVYPNKVKTVNGAVITGDPNGVLLVNGVVHPVSKVILPLVNTISDIVAESDPEFRDLFGFLVLAKLYGTLATAGPFTVFAPVDAAFEKVDVSGLINNRTALADVLKNHVVSGTYWSAGLTDGMALTTLYGKQITLSIGGSGVSVDNAAIIATDVGASNGVIHVIDTVLVP